MFGNEVLIDNSFGNLSRPLGQEHELLPWRLYIERGGCPCI